MPDTSIERIFDHLTDIWLSVKGILRELEIWDKRPVRGRISIAGVESMTDTTGTTDIPDTDTTATVDWQDRLGGSISHDKTDTAWSAVDQDGNASAAVTVAADPNADDESATVTFTQGSGQFKIVATTAGANGDVTAESAMYNITPGAPAVGVIQVNPT